MPNFAGKAMNRCIKLEALNELKTHEEAIPETPTGGAVVKVSDVRHGYKVQPAAVSSFAYFSSDNSSDIQQNIFYL